MAKGIAKVIEYQGKKFLGVTALCRFLLARTEGDKPALVTMEVRYMRLGRPKRVTEDHAAHMTAVVKDPTRVYNFRGEQCTVARIANITGASLSAIRARIKRAGYPDILPDWRDLDDEEEKLRRRRDIESGGDTVSAERQARLDRIPSGGSWELEHLNHLGTRVIEGCGHKQEPVYGFGS